MSGLASLGDLTGCVRLEQLGLYESRPADKRLDPLLKIASLRHLVIGDTYPPAQASAIRNQFQGETLRYRSETVRGDLANVAVRWRQPVHPCLGIE